LVKVLVVDSDPARAAGIEAVVRFLDHDACVLPFQAEFANVQAALALVVAEIAGARVIVADTHLDLDASARLAHTAELLALLKRARDRYEAPVVLCGDINEEPEGPSWNALTGFFTDAYAAAPRGPAATYSSRRPARRIDGIFTDPRIEVLGCGLPPGPAPAADYPRASDHLPVLAELRLPP